MSIFNKIFDLFFGYLILFRNEQNIKQKVYEILGKELIEEINNDFSKSSVSLPMVIIDAPMYNYHVIPHFLYKEKNNPGITNKFKQIYHMNLLILDHSTKGMVVYTPKIEFIKIIKDYYEERPII